MPDLETDLDDSWLTESWPKNSLKGWAVVDVDAVVNPLSAVGVCCGLEVVVEARRRLVTRGEEAVAGT